MTLLDVTDNSEEYMQSVKKIYNSLCLFADWFSNHISELAANLTKFNLDLVVNLPDQIRTAGEQWAKFGWVPFLPTFSIENYLESMIIPQSQEQADTRMNRYFEQNSTTELFSKIAEYLDKNRLTTDAFYDATKCFELGLYTSCTLALFSILDGVFLNGQNKRPDSRRRDLSRTAVERVYNKNETCGYLVSAIVVHKVILDLFRDADDFTIPETGLNRNYISHGMNQRRVTREDCLKLFVLLYNVCLLFDAGIFSWVHQAG